MRGTVGIGIGLKDPTTSQPCVHRTFTFIVVNHILHDTVETDGLALHLRIKPPEKDIDNCAKGPIVRMHIVIQRQIKLIGIPFVNHLKVIKEIGCIVTPRTAHHKRVHAEVHLRQLFVALIGLTELLFAVDYETLFLFRVCAEECPASLHLAAIQRFRHEERQLIGSPHCRNILFVFVFILFIGHRNLRLDRSHNTVIITTAAAHAEGQHQQSANP